jgi:uncharacterized protein involved in exopolysaccharide biosynthesis
MTKVIEIIFRNKWKLLALLLVPVLVSGVIVFFLPRSYQVTARLWANQRYIVVGATGPESDLQSTPSATQAAALNDLLQTENFDLAVAKDTGLAQQMNVPAADKQRLNDALYNEISGKVLVTASSTNLIVITYSNKSPTVATKVVQAVITNFGQQSATNATTEGQQLLKIYQGRLAAAQQEVDTATRAAAQYLRDHNLTPATGALDPQYQTLSVQADQARATLTNIQTEINSIQQKLAPLGEGGTGLYSVLDAPQIPSQPESRTKSLGLGGALGLALGLLMALGYLLIVVRLDQSIYSPADMPAVSEYPVVIQIPRLPRKSTAWITRSNGKLLSDKGA